MQHQHSRPIPGDGGGGGCNRNTQFMITSPSHSLCKKTETYKHYNASEPSLINKYGPITSVPALYLITAGAIISSCPFTVIYLSDKSCQDIYSNISPTSHDLKLPELKNNNPLITLQAPSNKSSKLNRKNEKKKNQSLTRFGLPHCHLTVLSRS